MEITYEDRQEGRGAGLTFFPRSTRRQLLRITVTISRAHPLVTVPPLTAICSLLTVIYLKLDLLALYLTKDRALLSAYNYCPLQAGDEGRKLVILKIL
jgi:hypothetical protein